MSFQDNLQSGRTIGGPGLKSLIESPQRILTKNPGIAQFPSKNPGIAQFPSFTDYLLGSSRSMDNSATQPEHINPDDPKFCFKISSELDLDRLHRLSHHIYQLHIQNYYLKYLPDTLASKMSTVRELYIVDCSFESLPLDLFPNLFYLSLKDCPNLVSVSAESSLCLPALEMLLITGCPNLNSFPDAGLPTPNISVLEIFNCSNLTKLPNFLDSLTHLEYLHLRGCPNLESFSTMSLPSNLLSLSIALCDKLIPKKEWGLHNLHTLCEFKIEGEFLGLKIFPEEDLLPANLGLLHISSLLSLETVGSGLHQLTGLAALEIFSCPKLQSLSKECVPSSLVSLCIKKCPKLTPKLLETAGNMRVRHLEIDDRVISESSYW